MGRIEGNEKAAPFEIEAKAMHIKSGIDPKLKGTVSRPSPVSENLKGTVSRPSAGILNSPAF